MFFVLQGELTLRLDDETVIAPAGSFVLVPPGTVHTFSNPGSEPVRYLSLMAPGGFEQYFLEVKEALGGGPPDPAVMAQLMSKYDIELV
jgi:mannose-6-phosphate isomerase-like protein (cupin superfamily)